MPTARQLVVQVPPTARGLGTASTSDLHAEYPASPIYDGELTDENVQTQFQNLCIVGVVNDGGHLFGEVDRDYSGAAPGTPGAPDLATVTADNQGNPLSSPYAPSLASPPGGVNDWANQPVTKPETEAAGRSNLAPFVGDGLASPSDTSAVISQQTIGSLKKGTSTPSS